MFRRNCLFLGMRRLKSLTALVMALMVALTSMGVAVSTHTCTESGHTEIGFKPLKACCPIAKGHGFRAEPCCKVNTNHVKLPTVSRGCPGVEMAAPILAAHFPFFDLALPEPALLINPRWVIPKPHERWQPYNGRAIQTVHRQFLI